MYKLSHIWWQNIMEYGGFISAKNDGKIEISASQNVLSGGQMGGWPLAPKLTLKCTDIQALPQWIYENFDKFSDNFA